MQSAIRRGSLLALRRLSLFAASLWIVFLVELMSRSGWRETVRWFVLFSPCTIVNGLVVLSFLLLLSAVTGRIRGSFWILSAVFLAAGLVNGIKTNILGVPLSPWDFLLASETKDMTAYVSGLFNIAMITGFIVFIPLSMALLGALGMTRGRLMRKRRAVMALAAIVLMAVVYDDGKLSLQRLIRIQNMVWDPSENVRTNGFLLTTLMNVKFLFLHPPEGYDGSAVSAITASTAPVVPQGDGLRPNIIFVLSESFWDATQIPGVSFSKDPLPFFHALAERFTSGTMQSPQYGGGTANVEFEVLTGNSMRFLPQGSVPYNQYINRNIESLASILARQGYETTAISPFHSWFFNSKKVYEHFGFAKYISQEFFEPDFEGPFMSDRAVAKNIIEATEASPGPDFVFANTMQNHYNYLPGKFKENTISVSGVSGESRGLLETYAQGLLGADDMLRRLVGHYGKKAEPTILVFFGDHLPSLGENYKVYKETGFVQEDDPEFYDKLHRVPLVVWSNYLPQDGRETIRMNTSFLGPYILQLAKRPGNYYTDFLTELWRRAPLLPSESGYAAAGIKEMMKNYEKLQYDTMFGEQFAYGERKDAPPQEPMVLGFGPMRIDGVRTEKIGYQSVLTVTGSNFPYRSVVTIDGKQAQAKWRSAGEIAVVPDGSRPLGAPMNIRVCVKDSRDKTIAESNIYVSSE